MANDPHSTASPAEAPKPEIAHPRTAAIWIWVMVAGMSVAAFMADRDSRNRSLLEQAVERTAVGDRVFFPTEGRPALLFEGKPLVLAGASESRPESAMLLAGTAEGLPYRLYAPSERMDANGTTGGPTWWLKTGPGLFLKASR
jgi:hypothetical protein